MINVPLRDLIPGGEIDSRSDTDVEIDSLANSIAHLGLILPLAVMPEGDGIRYRVIDGNRRLKALQQIHEGNGEAPVPVYVQESDDIDLAMEQSLAANIERVPLHPMDQYEAFAKFGANASDTSITAIAAHFAVPERQVRQYMALGALSPKARWCYREGSIDMRLAKLLTRKTVEEQDRLLNQDTVGWRLTQVLEEEFTTGTIKNGSTVAKFVGRDWYLQNGGTMANDLFADEGYEDWADPNLACALASEKVRKIMTDAEAEGWAFVEQTDEWIGNNYSTEEGAGEPVGMSDDDKQRIAKLEAEMDAIYAHPDEGEELSNAQHAEIEIIEQAINEFTDDWRGYTDEQKARCGVVIDHRFEVHYGCTRRKGAKPLTQVNEIPIAAGSSAAEKPIADSVVQDLDNALTLATAHAIAEDYEMGIRMLALQLLHNCMAFKLERLWMLGVNTQGSAFLSLPPEIIEPIIKKCGLRKAKNFEGEMKAMRKLDDFDVHQILAWFAATSLTKVHRGKELVQYLDKLGKLEISKHYTPTIDNFYGRLTKDQLQLLADTELKSHGLDVHSMKKSEAVTVIARLMPEDYIPEAIRPVKPD